MNQVTRVLEGLAGEAARLEAEVLLGEARGQSRFQLLADLHQEVSREQAAVLRRLVNRRLSGESLAYVVGRKDFMSLAFLVNRDVLVPRPETEILVETALEALGRVNRRYPAVADIGTGSGNVSLSLAYYCRRARVLATDISGPALTVARENARLLGLTGRVCFLQGDLLVPLIARIGKKGNRHRLRERRRGNGVRERRRVFLVAPGPERAPTGLMSARMDMVVANLPYIPSRDITGLPLEVRREPRSALDGGHDGLAHYRRLVRQTPLVLRPGGYLMVEIGCGQEETMAEIMSLVGFHGIGVVQDASGRPRVVTGRWLPKPGLLPGNQDRGK